MISLDYGQSWVRKEGGRDCHSTESGRWAEGQTWRTMWVMLKGVGLYPEGWEKPLKASRLRNGGVSFSFHKEVGKFRGAIERSRMFQNIFPVICDSTWNSQHQRNIPLSHYPMDTIPFNFLMALIRICNDLICLHVCFSDSQFTVYPLHLVQCLAHSGCSIHICRKNEWVIHERTIH